MAAFYTIVGLRNATSKMQVKIYNKNNAFVLFMKKKTLQLQTSKQFLSEYGQFYIVSKCLPIIIWLIEQCNQYNTSLYKQKISPLAIFIQNRFEFLINTAIKKLIKNSCPNPIISPHNLLSYWKTTRWKGGRLLDKYQAIFQKKSNSLPSIWQVQIKL